MSRSPQEADGDAKRPTIKDVARAAGVSYQTVSRVVNEIDAVRPATRARVVEAIELTGWSRDETATALARRKAPHPIPEPIATPH